MIKNKCEDKTEGLTIVKGDDKLLDLTFYADEEKKIPIDITGYVVFFTVKKKPTDPDSEALIIVDRDTHTLPSEGKTEIEIPNSMTNIPIGTYYYDIQIKDTDDRIFTVARGKFEVVWQATKRTEI